MVVIVPIFVLISVIGLLAALGTVLSRNLVHAALYLVAFFFTIAPYCSTKESGVTG